MGREEVAFSSRQPSWTAVEQMAGQLGLLTIEESFPLLHLSGFWRKSFTFLLVLDNYFLLSNLILQSFAQKPFSENPASPGHCQGSTPALGLFAGQGFG